VIYLSRDVGADVYMCASKQTLILGLNNNKGPPSIRPTEIDGHNLVFYAGPLKACKKNVFILYSLTLYFVRRIKRLHLQTHNVLNTCFCFLS